MNGRYAIPRTVWGLSLLAMGLFVGVGLVPGLSASLRDHITALLIALIAALTCWYAFRTARQFAPEEMPGRVWLHFSRGLLLWTAAEVIWLVYWGDVPTPSLADIPWLGGYGFLGASLLVQYRLLQGINPQQERRAMAGIVLAIAAGAAFLTWGSHQFNPQEPLLGLFINMVYPLADLALALMSLWMIRQFGAGRWGRPWLALFVFVVADAVYAWFESAGFYDVVQSLTLIADALYFGAYLVLALAFYAQYHLVKRA